MAQYRQAFAHPLPIESAAAGRNALRLLLFAAGGLGAQSPRSMDGSPNQNAPCGRPGCVRFWRVRLETTRSSQCPFTRLHYDYMPRAVLPAKDFAHRPLFLLWTDALCFREMAKEPPDKYLESMCIRNAVLSAWTSLEMACRDALGVKKIKGGKGKQSFIEKLSRELEKKEKAASIFTREFGTTSTRRFGVIVTFSRTLVSNQQRKDSLHFQLPRTPSNGYESQFKTSTNKWAKTLRDG
jgi:hypothetical protein